VGPIVILDFWRKEKSIDLVGIRTLDRPRTIIREAPRTAGPAMNGMGCMSVVWIHLIRESGGGILLTPY
jgi:hypothetical protein